MSTASATLVAIKKHFLEGKSLSHLECLSLYATHRLSANVHILRYQHKMDILTERNELPNGTAYLSYWLQKEELTASMSSN